MNYIYLLKSLFIYENYVKYRHHIKITKEEHKELFYLFKALDSIMELSKNTISFEEYALWVQVNLGKGYEIFLKLIESQSTSDVIGYATLQSIKKKTIASNLSTSFHNYAEGRTNEEEIERLLQEFNEDEKNEQESPFVEDSFVDIYNGQIRDPGLRWRLHSLNRAVGSLRKGDFGVIFARPETGKTTFLASEISHFSSQSVQPILWFNNEEQGTKVKFRIFQAYFGLSLRDVASNINHYQDLYTEQTNIKIYDNASIHKRKVDELCKEYKPALIVFDQLSKVKGFSNDREDLRLGQAFAWGRELAKEYCPVLAVNQADASGEGKKYLNMDNVANAKTAIQAEADLIIGIGKSHDNGFEYIRHLNICKNKLSGDEDTDPTLRHSKIDVLIQPDQARFKDL